MSILSEQEEAVCRHYDENILAYEVERLPAHCPVEFAVTARYLRRYIERGAIVAEVGVGGGQYSELLARHGCSLHLVDIAAQLLRAAQARLQAAGLSERIIESRRASATDLSHITAASCDAVLFLGPLYHLCEPADRRRAVSEAARVLKPRGIVFAAGINRLAYLRDAFRSSSPDVLAHRTFYAGFLDDGNLDPEHAPPLGYAHLSTGEEFRSLFKDAFVETALVGVDSFTSALQEMLPQLPEAAGEAWLDLVEQTGRTPDGLGASDHFLYIGRRRG